MNLEDIKLIEKEVKEIEDNSIEIRVNDFCPCTRKSCRRHSDCEACRRFHEKRKRLGPPQCKRMPTD